MRKFFATIFNIVMGYINSTFEGIADSIESHDKPAVIKKIVTLSVTVLGIVGFFALIIALLYAGREAILAVAAPVVMLAVLVKSYALNHPATIESVKPPQSPGTIELAKARAEKAYPLLTQTAFLLFSEICHYLPGLVKPFSLRDVVPKVHYEITASFLTIYHFIISKGDCETNRETIKEILETLLEQHLAAHDLPLSVPANYTSSDGEIYPGLIVDGVYDAARYYRVDLIITNDAAVARLKATSDGSATSGIIVHDEDFD